MNDLLNKKILITGASSGIGAGIARAFAQYHTQLILHYNNNYDGVVETQKIVTQSGSQAKIIQCNFSQQEALKNFLLEAVESFSGVDILVNNAGVIPKTSITDTDIIAWKNTLAVNLDAPFLLSKHFAEQLIEKQQQGSIINISSIHGEQSCENFAAYAASKSALNALTKAQSIEWAKHNIRVNAIAPGVIEVERNRERLQKQQDLWAQKIPLGRHGLTSDIAEMAVFLSSDSAAWMTGQVVTIDGGMTVRGNFPMRNEISNDTKAS